MLVPILFLIGASAVVLAVRLRRTRKLLAGACAGGALATIGILVIVLRLPAPRARSEACEKIREDVRAGLHVGDSEKSIAPFFESRRWRHGSAPIIGLYSAEIFVRRSFLGAVDSVIVVIDVKSGVIARIEVTDRVQFL